ncbi:MAG: hypothetical protein VCD00_01730 [Candidatus Hydrogenedentota bacterium]
MIEIQLTTALALYSVLIGLMGAGIWLYTEFSVTRKQQFLGEQFLWRCMFCGCTYLDESGSSISKCPRCDSLNSLKDAGAPHNLPDLGENEPENTGESSGGGSKRKRRGGRRGPRKRR